MSSPCFVLSVDLYYWKLDGLFLVTSHTFPEFCPDGKAVPELAPVSADSSI